MWKKHRVPAWISVVALSAVPGLVTFNTSAATNQFRGVNWADPGDNFQPGILYISGLSSSDTYDSALAVGNSIMDQFVSKLGANSVRLPVNEATVSKFWSTYTGAIDAVLSKGMVVLCYWDSAKSNKPADMNAFWAMWKTVVDKYGSNDNAYFEIFNEPNMYSKTDLANLYNSWLTQFPTVPKGRVILDGTGNAQNVSDVGSDSRLDGCLLAVHDYSFFGSESMTSESQWVSQFKGEVGNYADRTVCTEWGGPMSPGSKNGKSYDYLDYSKSPTNYFEAYIRGISSQLRSWSMGSFYWIGLKDGDWYSMTTKSGSGAKTTLSIPNQSGLDRLQYSWTGPSAGGVDAGVGGSAGRDGAVAGGAGGAAGSSGAGGGGGSGGASANSSGAGGSNLGRGGTDAVTGGAGGSRTGQSGAGGAVATGGVAAGSGGITAAASGTGGTSPTTSSGGGPGTSAIGSGGAGSGGSTSSGTTRPANAGGSQSSGCSCTVGGTPYSSSRSHVLLLGLAAVTLGTMRRRRAVRR
jgi:MYXO-CTERM domain-containing protein